MPCYVLVSEQLKRIYTDDFYGNFLCSRLVCSGYGDLFSQIDSCQPFESGNMLGSAGCALAAGEHKIPSVWLSGKDLMCTSVGFLG